MDKNWVLLVDDEKEFVETLAERLKMRGYQVETALDGEEAVRIAMERVPVLVVLDLRMPGIDGLEVLRWIKKHHPRARVIMLTGHGSEVDEEIAMRLGACEYLQKPVEIEKLVGILNRALREYEMAE